MKYVSQFGIIAGITFAGEILRRFVPLPVPAGIYGLLLLLAALITGIIKLEQVREAALFLVDILQLLFVPATVGLIVSYTAFSGVLAQSVVIIILSTVFVIAATGLVVQRVLRGRRDGQGGEISEAGVNAIGRSGGKIE